MDGIYAGGIIDPTSLLDLLHRKGLRRGQRFRENSSKYILMKNLIFRLVFCCKIMYIGCRLFDRL